jgi:peroxiredoxin
VLIAWSGYDNHRRHLAGRMAHSEAVLVPGSEGNMAASAANASDQDPAQALENKPAPKFTLADIDGKKVSLSDYKGKAVLVNFWATWCAPCKIEIPWFEDFQKQYASQGFEILGVSNDDIDEDDKAKMVQQKEAIRTFVAKQHMNYPVLLDGDSIATPYGGVDSLPTSFFIDRKGVVVAETTGLYSRDEIEANIKKALASGGQ